MKKNYEDIYVELMQLAHYLLSHSEFIEGDIEELKQNFIENLYAVLQMGFDLSITFDDFIKLNDLKNEFEIAKFSGIVIERESSYALLNRYLLEFISLYLTNAKKEYQSIILQNINDIRFEDDAIIQINNAFLKAIA